MPKIDFRTVEDTADFSPLPMGKYLCRVAAIELGETSAGDERWLLRLTVDEGPYSGRTVIDNLSFSEAALKRVKFVCERLGVDVTGEVDVSPDLLLGRLALVTVELGTYEDEFGARRIRNKVPYSGYEEPTAGGDFPANEIRSSELERSDVETPF